MAIEMYSQSAGMSMDVIRDTSARNARSARTRENEEGFNEVPL